MNRMEYCAWVVILSIFLIVGCSGTSETSSTSNPDAIPATGATPNKSVIDRYR